MRLYKLLKDTPTIKAGTIFRELDYYDDGEIVRYKTRAEAEKSIKENERDWKIYFGIKEE